MNLTENLREWRKARNITKADYLTFAGNILEELLEPIYRKEAIEDIKIKILTDYFNKKDVYFEKNKTKDIIDAIQDIQIFCINETELMGYDNLKCNYEVFKEINSRKQDPAQKLLWLVKGAKGKWQKSLLPEHIEKWYKANYEECKL